MTAIFKPEGPLFRATEHAGGPWSPDLLQGSATTALMTREVERLAAACGFAVRRLTFDLWRRERLVTPEQQVDRAPGVGDFRRRQVALGIVPGITAGFQQRVA